MSPESGNPSPNGSSETRPLWIIAIALAAIALCLILITIRIQLDRLKAAAVNEAKLAPVEVSYEKPNRPPVQRRTFERPLPEVPALETASPSAPTVSLPITNGEPAFPRTIPAYGGFAAEVSGLPGTNASAGIVGRVTLRGTPPIEPVIDESASPCWNQASNAPPANPLFKVSGDGGLSEVIVAITAGLEGGQFSGPRTNHLWTVTNCQIYPFVSVVRTGQRVSFLGGANPPHFIQFAGTKLRSPLPVTSLRVNLATLPQSTNELVQLKCLQHPWETAYFARYDHPFFAITDTNGNFTIPRMPAGTYTLQAIHLGWVGTNEVKQVLSVRNDETAVVNFLVDAPGMKMSTQDLSAQR